MYSKLGAIASAAAASVTVAFAAAVSAAPETPVNDIRFARVQLETGITLNYAESGPADGEVLILLHGFTDSWFSFSRIMPLLPPNVRMFALDQRGHGESEKPESGYAMRELGRDVVAFMNAQGIARATVLGHSMGGFVAQQVAAIAPERVARLILIGTATTPRNIVGADEFVREMQAVTEPVPVDFIRAFQESTITVPVPPEFLSRVIAESQKLPARVWHAALRGMMDTPAPAALQQHRIPTLVLWGDQDAIMPASEQQALVAQHGSAILRVYRGVGHAPTWEIPEQVARDVAGFLDVEPAPPKAAR